jgi:hypothetical protein
LLTLDGAECAEDTVDRIPGSEPGDSVPDPHDHACGVQAQNQWPRSGRHALLVAAALMLGIATIGIDSNPGVTPSVAAGGGIMLTEGG